MLDPKVKNIFKFFKIVRDYNNSESKSLFLLFHHNLSFKTVLIKNFYEVNKLMLKHNDPSSDAMWKNPDSGVRSKIQQTIYRLTFNYLSSLFGYIDFSRIHNIPFLKKNDGIFLIAESTNIFKNDPKHKFAQDLRNYAIHNKPIPIGSELTMNIEWDTPRRNIYISRDESLLWSGWATSARKFIEEQGEKIYLFDILKEHFSVFIKYQSELFTLLLKVFPITTDHFLTDIEKIYSQSVLIRNTWSLPFNHAFLRYIKYRIQKSKNIT